MKALQCESQYKQLAKNVKLLFQIGKKEQHYTNKSGITKQAPMKPSEVTFGNMPDIYPQLHQTVCKLRLDLRIITKAAFKVFRC